MGFKDILSGIKKVTGKNVDVDSVVDQATGAVNKATNNKYHTEISLAEGAAKDYLKRLDGEDTDNNDNENKDK